MPAAYCSNRTAKPPVLLHISYIGQSLEADVPENHCQSTTLRTFLHKSVLRFFMDHKMDLV